MTEISAIDVNRALKPNGATYNAVKIQINDPKTCIPNKSNNINDNGTYNGVAIEVNRPSVENCEHNNHRHHHCYEYPCAECAMTADFAPIHPISVPKLPVYPIAYQSTSFVATLPEMEDVIVDEESTVNEEQVVDEPEEEIIVYEEVSVPEPNLVQVEDQKLEKQDISFNGLNFKADATKQPIEIVPPVEIMPDVDIPKVLDNLSNQNFDIQAKQMEEIARVSMEDPQKAVPYIVTEVFSELINIVEKDTSELAPPTEKQIELRQQIIINEIVKAEAKEKNEAEPTSLPYEISEADIAEASNISPLEQAERNKEYALYTMAILSKVYADEIERHTGNIVPLTELPGISSVVDSLKSNQNSSIKISAIDALRYIYRPEYKEELNTIMNIAANDSNPYVARNAAIALESMN